MRISLGLVAALAGLSLASCGDELGGKSSQGRQNSEAFEALSYDEHLRCAALISAYSGLAGSSVIRADEEQDSRSLVTLGWHINAYAIPQNISEADAFKALKRLREELKTTMSSQAIVDEARECMEVVD